MDELRQHCERAAGFGTLEIQRQAREKLRILPCNEFKEVTGRRTRTLCKGAIFAS
jgi:hypothetical protein